MKKMYYSFLRKYYYLIKNLITRLFHLNKFKPLSDKFGLERGQPIDRYYIEKFLNFNSKYIKGKVLEFGDDRYSNKFNCINPDVISIDSQSKSLVKKSSNLIIMDITKKKLKPKKYDVVIATQVIQFIYEIDVFKKNIYNALKLNGYLILTCSGISQFSRYDINRWGEYWRFTDAAIRKIFKTHFKIIKLETYGNLFVAEKSLEGFAAEEISKNKLKYKDESFPVLHAILLKKIK